MAGITKAIERAQIYSWLESLPKTLSTVFAAQKDRVLLTVPVWLALGIGLYFSLPFEPLRSISVFLTLMTFSAWFLLLPYRANSTLQYGISLVSGFLFLCALGFSSAQYSTGLYSTPVLSEEIGPVDVAGTVRDVETLEAGAGLRLVLESLTIEDLPPEETPERIRLTVRQKGTYRPGDRVSVLAGLNPPSAPVKPGAFDFQRYAYFKKLGAFGFSYNAPVVTARAETANYIQRLELLRQDIGRQVTAVQAPEIAAVSKALMTGERAGITEDDWAAMRHSGLAHMLAISGLHVGLIASVVFFSIRLLMAGIPPIALRYPIKKYAAFAALLAAGGYTLLVGAPVPTVRALMMTGVVLIAIMLDRMPFSLRLVALAATAVLLWAPQSLFGASFQLSFAAVTGLIVFYEWLRPHWSGWFRQANGFRKLLLYFLGVCFTTIIATLATAPYILYHFQHLAVYSLLSNIVAVPIMAFVVMPAVVFSFVLMPFGLEWLPLKVMEYGVMWVLEIAHDVEDIPGSSLFLPAMPLSAMVMFTLGALWFIIWRGQGRVLAIVPFFIAALCLSGHQAPDILVSSGGKLTAIKTADGHVAVPSLRYDRFAAEIWARHYGMQKDDFMRWQDLESVSCDDFGCRTYMAARRVAFTRHPASYKEDCEWADVLISQEPVPDWKCDAKIIIDRFDLYNKGAHALYFHTDAEPVIETVSDKRGERPWTVSHRR